MFDLNNNERIAQLIKNRKEGSFIEPLYVKIYKDPYAITELNTVTEYSHSTFKIGFGSSNSIFTKYSFPIEYNYAFYTVKLFKEYDEASSSNIQYRIFESGDVDPSISLLHEQIHYYHMLFSSYIEKNVRIYKQSLIQAQLESFS